MLDCYMLAVKLIDAQFQTALLAAHDKVCQGAYIVILQHRVAHRELALGATHTHKHNLFLFYIYCLT